MSMTGGYPVGARTIAQLLEQGRIQPRTARRMLCFCINAGPAFVVSTVGAALYSSVQAGFCLLTAHLGASALVGFFTCTGKESFEPAPPAGSAASGHCLCAQCVRRGPEPAGDLCLCGDLFRAAQPVLGERTAAPAGHGTGTTPSNRCWLRLLYRAAPRAAGGDRRLHRPPPRWAVNPPSSSPLFCSPSVASPPSARQQRHSGSFQ